MNNAIPCVGGNNAILEIINNDCNCVGIASVTDNRPQSNTFTIVYTNGQSQSFPFLQGNTGPAGGIGPVGPAGQNGANGAAVLENDPTISVNTITTAQPLKTYALPANTVSSNKSQIYIAARVDILQATIMTAAVTFGGLTLATATINVGALSIDCLYFEIVVIRTASNAASVVFKIYDVSGNNVTKEFISDPIGIAPDFTVNNNIQVVVTADSTATPGGAACKLLSVIYTQFGTIAPASNGAEQSFTAQQTVSGQQAYTPVIGFNGGTIKQLYLDGNLLAPTGAGQWSYDNTTDTLTFNSITITSVQWIQGTYTA